jgi:hypothetical protein
MRSGRRFLGASVVFRALFRQFHVDRIGFEPSHPVELLDGALVGLGLNMPSATFVEFLRI